MKKYVIGLLALMMSSRLAFSTTDDEGAAVVSTDAAYIQGYAGLGLAPKVQDTNSQGKTVDTLKYKTGFTTGGAVGYQYNDFRFEGELKYLYNSLAEKNGDSGVVGHTSVIGGLGNIYYVWNRLPSLVKPYIGGGAGYGEVTTYVGDNTDDLVVSLGNGAFAYQGLAGLKYPLNDDIDVSFDYRYFATTQVKIATGPNTHIDEVFQDHTFNLGIMYHFPNAVM